MRPEANPATFSIARPDVVRAVNQRWLLKFWKRHLGAQPRAAMAGHRRREPIADIVQSELPRCHRQRRRRVFRRSLQWRDDRHCLWRRRSRGRRLDDVMPPEHRDDWLVPYRLAVGCRCPIYTIHDVNDRVGRLVHCERLRRADRRSHPRFRRVHLSGRRVRRSRLDACAAGTAGLADVRAYRTADFGLIVARQHQVCGRLAGATTRR